MDAATAPAPAPADRRPGEDTRGAIRRAAARLFLERGFTATAVRDIARAAGVDPALVIRHFGSKERLFLETMTVERTFDAIGEAALEQLGVAVLRRILLGNPRSRLVYTALMRAADRPEVRSYLIRATEVQLVEPIAARIGGSAAQYRASLIAAQVVGLLNALWILEDPALVSRPIEAVIQTYGRALQVLVDGA